MEYTSNAVGSIVSAATGVGVVATILPDTGKWPLVALTCAAVAGVLLMSLLVSTIYKRVSR